MWAAWRHDPCHLAISGVPNSERRNKIRSGYLTRAGGQHVVHCCTAACSAQWAAGRLQYTANTAEGSVQCDTFSALLHCCAQWARGNICGVHTDSLKSSHVIGSATKVSCVCPVCMPNDGTPAPVPNKGLCCATPAQSFLLCPPEKVCSTWHSVGWLGWQDPSCEAVL